MAGALTLIRELQGAGISITLGYCSTDVILHKAAGADICATGKFFNLRRFTGSRFEEPAQRGRQLPYFCEESLTAFLREPDISRLIRAKYPWSDSTKRNPFADAILEGIAKGSGEAWLALGWKQFMWWFADVESRIATGEDADDILRRSERAWLDLDDLRPRVLMTEPRNTGAWVRPWRQALSDAGLL
jgi:hypothetical protein